jgi:NAD+ kinase
VLVLSKTTRWETLSRNADHTNYASEHALRQKHDQQQVYINEICDQLRKRGLDVSVVKASDYTTEAINNAHLVISAGGDGTFLTAASMIRDSTPCIGINTDPVGSEGHLCLLGKEHCDVRNVIDRFLDGKFRFFPRHRIRVTLLNSGVANGDERDRSDSVTHEEHHQQPQEVKFR